MSAISTSRPLEWRGDPVVLVYAVRYALGSHGSHAPELLRQTLADNRDALPPTALAAIVRDITTWLDGPGRASSPVDRDTWARAQAALTTPATRPATSPAPRAGASR